MKYEDAITIMYPAEKRQDDLAINPYLFLLRKVSFSLSFALYKGKVTANQVTLTSAVSYFVPAIAVILSPSATTIVWFTLFANIYYFLDVVDGNIARLQKLPGLKGKFYDETLNMIAGATTPLVVLVYLLGASAPWYVVLATASIPVLRTIRRTNIEYWKEDIEFLNDRENISKTVRNPYTKSMIVTINALLIPSLLPVFLINLGDIELYLTVWALFYFAYYASALFWTLRFIFKALR